MILTQQEVLKFYEVYVGEVKYTTYLVKLNRVDMSVSYYVCGESSLGAKTGEKCSDYEEALESYKKAVEDFRQRYEENEQALLPTPYAIASRKIIHKYGLRLQFRQARFQEPYAALVAFYGSFRLGGGTRFGLLDVAPSRDIPSGYNCPSHLVLGSKHNERRNSPVGYSFRE